MTINSPAAILLAYYLVVGEQQGVSRDKLRGTIQTDILKEYIAQKEYIYPPEPSMRLVTDMVEFCAKEMPLWHPISISGYHIREAGSTAAQELAFTLHDGFTYVEWALERGLDIDDFAPRLSFFFNAHIDFFEEIAKYRAARRIWARELQREVRREERQEPPDAVPHADGRRLADVAAAAREHRPHGDRGAGRRPRRHAVAPHELVRRGARAADRARGADRAAHAAGDRARDRRHQRGRPARRRLLRRGADEHAWRPRPTGTSTLVNEHGGMVEAIKQNVPQREIAEASYRYQQEVESGQRVIVGVNRYEVTDEEPIPILKVDPASETRQIERLKAMKGGATAPRSSRRSRRSSRAPPATRT